MATDATDLFTAALGLPLPERVALVEILIDSLPTEDQAKIDQAWQVEIQRRIEEYERGESQLVEAEEVFAQLRKREAE